MKLLKKALFLSLLIAGFISFQACEKSKSEATLDESKTTEIVNEDFAESTFDEVQEIADQAYGIASNGLKSGKDDDFRLGDCVTITMDTTIRPRTMTIDFGEVNCECRDGKFRRGQIIVTFTGRYLRPGTVITHSFNNFYVDDNHVQGTKVMTNLGFNDDGFMQFHNVVDGSITFADDGNVISWNSDKTRTWIAGSDTPRWRDDVYLIEGNSAVTNSSGNGVTRLITNPLRRELSCRHFVSGTIEITPSVRPQRILDYGDGTCDNLATVTVGDSTFTIVLRR